MTLVNSIILGLIQGLAEFLPISSSGHLAILKEILNVDAGIVYDVMLHLGTLLAIFVAFWKDITKLFVEGIMIIRDFFVNVFRFFGNLGKKKGEGSDYVKIVGTPYRKFVMLIIVSTIPTGILGIVLKDIVETAASSLVVVGICLIVTAVLLQISDRCNAGKKRPRQIKYSEAGIVGVVQGLATLPGISRSGSTITACLLCGFDRNFAIKYSFIMSIPAVLGAVVLELGEFVKMSITQTELVNYGIGTAIAAVVGYICIKTMLVVVRGKKLKGFSFYCFIAGLFAIIYYFV